MGPVDRDGAHVFLPEPRVRAFLDRLPRERIFAVRFVKADGSLRVMVCRRDVRSHLKGGPSTLAGHPNLVSVFDMNVGDYRCFDARRVVAARAGDLEA